MARLAVRRIGLGALSLVLIARLAAAESPLPFRLRSSPGLAVIDPGSWKRGARGVELRRTILERTDPYYVLELKLARFDLRRIVPRIILSAQYSLKASDVKTLAEKSGALAAINANYFDEKARPLGFLKTARQTVNSGVSRSSLYTGIFAVKQSVPFIAHRDDFQSSQADEALQAGPLLIHRGAPVSVSRGAGRYSRRALIGLDSEQKLLVAVTDNVVGGLSWVEVQELFGGALLQATELLNLDGGGSAQLYVRGVNGQELAPGSSLVPVAIGFFPR
jgi:uncharacterized protein YigE (DUF2233 family)